MAKAQIMVGDRDLRFAKELAANLESLGYAVTEVVSSPEEALKKAQEKQPDLVLLDLGLLREGKKKAPQDLRKRLPNLVYLVGEEDPETLKRAKITHSFDYLRKAYDSRELETIIDMALCRRKWQQRDEKQTAKIDKITAKFKSETDRRQLQENAIQAERKKLFAVLDTLPAYVALLAPDYSVPYANREFERRFGAAEGRKCYEFLFGRTSPCPDCETYKVLKTNAPLEWEWSGPDGRHYQIYDFPFPDIDGSPLILEMGVDVTALKEKEAEVNKMGAALRRSYDELEARVQDRTQELAQSNAALQNEVAERLWSEKKLKDSEERYRHLVDLSPDAIAVSIQGELVFINPAGARLFGANHYRELVGKPALDLIHPEDRDVVQNRLRRLTNEGGRTKLREIKILRLDGRAVNVEAAGVGTTYQEQSAVQVVLRDITARKRTEKELEHQASFPRLNPNPVLEADFSGNITYANAASLNSLKKLGLENQTSSFLPPDLDGIIKAAAETGQTVFHREVEINNAFFAETIAFSQEFSTIRIYAQDITLQKRAEIERQESLEKLQASEEELQVINEELQGQAKELRAQTKELQAANQEMQKAHVALRESREDLNRAQAVAHTGSWRLDVRQNKLLWSDETYRIFGNPQGTALTYEAFLARVHPEDREYVDKKWTAAVKGNPYDIEHRIVVGDQVKWVRERAELEFDHQGRLLGGFGTVQDITERMQAEQTIKASHDFLEIANRHTRTGPLIQDFVAEIRKYSGCEAVGIRILDGAGNIPYLAYEGFPQEFYELESPLNINSDRCMCINVIKGATDPQLSFYTPGGSFYMNGTTRFLATVAEEDKVQIRNMCNMAGYESVALVPIRLGNHTLGLIHLADQKEGMVPLSLVELMERISLQMGQAINRSRAEEALQESEERYRSLFQNNQAVMLLVDPEIGEIVGANPAASSFYGYPEKELAGKKITDINLASPQQVFQRMQGVKSGEASHFFFEHRLANGEVRDVEVYSSPLQVHGRTLLYSIIHDNTARKEAEDTLHASKDFLEIANRHTQMAPLLQDFTAAVKDHTGCEAVAIRILDEEGKIPYQANVGFSPEFIACESPLSVHSDRCLCINVCTGATDATLACYTAGSSCYINQLSHILGTNRPGVLGETRNVCHRFGYESVAMIPVVFGERILGLIHLADHRENVVPLSLVERLERIALTLGTAINRVRAEEERQRLVGELEMERSRLQAIIESAPEAIVVADANGCILMTNPAAERLYSHPDGCVEDAPSCAVFQFYQADGTACVPGDQPLLRSAREGETHRNVEMALAWPGGPRRDLLVNTAPIRDREGRSSGAVGLFQDITQRKMTEEKVRKLNLELSDRVREVSERTRQLEAANKELEAFSYSVSHDLRTPLRAIEGFARMLIEDHAPKLDQEGLRLLDVIRSNTHIMGDLIDDLLNLSRLGRREIKVRKLDLEGMATSVFGELKAQEPDRQMELILNPLPPAFGDRTLINQVLVNLLGNAVKFTHSRKKAVIEVGGWTEGKESIYFVKDNGVGFDMRYVDKIFGVFQRLHRREEFEGTGVGLAIVQRIVNRHGGRVWATGKVDYGAEIYFALPIKEMKREYKGEVN